MNASKNEKWLALCIPLLVILAPFAQIKLPRLPVALFDIGVLLAAALLFLSRPFKEHVGTLRAVHPLFWGLVAVYFFASVGRRHPAGNLKEIAQMAEYFILFPLILSCYAQSSEQNTARLIRALLLSGTVVTLLASYQIYWLNKPFVTAPFASRSALGLFFSVFVPIAFAAAAKPRIRATALKIIVALAVVSILSSCWIGIMIALLWITLRNVRKYASTLLLTFIFILVAGTIFHRSPMIAVEKDLALYEIVDGNREVRQRYVEAQAALNLIGENFLLGVGPANYQPNIGAFYRFYPKSNTLERDTQSGYLVLGSAVGFLGLLMLCSIYAFLIARPERAAPGFSIYSASAGIRAAGIALAVNTLFTFPLVSGIAPLIALIFVVSQKQKETPETLVSRQEESSIDLSKKTSLAIQFATLCLGFIILAPHLYAPPRPPAQTIRIKAKDYIKIAPPMIVSRDAGELILEIPNNSGKGWFHGTGGEAVFLVPIESPAEYTLWADTWWTDECTNCFNVSLNKMGEHRSAPFILGNDSAYQRWHWVRGSQYALSPGIYAVTFFNREDGVKLREIVLTTDKEFDRTLKSTMQQTITFPGNLTEKDIKQLSDNRWTLEKRGSRVVLVPTRDAAVLRLPGQRWTDFELSCTATLSGESPFTISFSPKESKPSISCEVSKNRFSIYQRTDTGSTQLGTIDLDGAQEIQLSLKRLRETISGSINGNTFRVASDSRPIDLIALSSSANGVTLSRLSLREVESFFDGFAGCDKNIAGDWKMTSGDWKIVEASLAGTSGVDDAILQVAGGAAFAQVGRTWWSNYRVSLKCFPTGVNGWGMGFCGTDERNLYLVRAAHPDGTLPYAGKLQLIKIVAGKENTLAETPWNFDLDQWYRLDVAAAYGNIAVSIDGAEMLSAHDETFKEGKVFLFTEDNPGVYFDNILVEFLPEP